MNANKIIAVLLMVLSISAFGQQKESDRLKKDQKDLLKKIDFTEKLLETTKQDKANISENLSLLERKIEYRKDLINNLDIQLSQLDAQITDLQKEVIEMEKKIEQHKLQYKIMIRQAYKMRSSDASLLFILSSESFNQANKRLEYLDQLKKYREDQIRKIEAAKIELQNMLTDLENKRADKETLISSKSTEHKRYVNDREYQKKTIQDLHGKEQELQDELAKQKKKNRELQNAITAALNKEILAEKKKNDGNTNTAEVEKEMKLSNKGFEANKGRLPWPVKGIVSRGFGRQPHPVYSTVFTNNEGIDISTSKGSTVKCVYDGEVSSVIVIPGAGKAVIVKHGNYRTIYSNLQETYVSTGDRVTTRQEIGALLGNSSGNSTSHFEIKKVIGEKISTLNPTYWLVN